MKCLSKKSLHKNNLSSKNYLKSNLSKNWETIRKPQNKVTSWNFWPKTFSLANLETISSKIPKIFSNPKTISLGHPKNFFNPKKFSMGLTYENVVGFANENVLGLEILLGFLILGFSDFGVFWFWGFLIMGFPTHSPKKLSKKFCPKIILS